MARPNRARASSMSLSLTIFDPRASILDVTRRRSPARERAGDLSSLVNRQVFDPRASAGVSLTRRVNAQCRQTEPAVERRLMDFNGLDFVDRHDVCRAPRPPVSRAKITIAQRVTQVPVIRGADEVDQRQQGKWPQGE